MNFSSDNVTGISPEILAALAAANSGSQSSYGADPLTAQVSRRLAEIFEHEVAVFPVATGTAANALALATLVPPWGVVYCHHEAHIVVDECGAPGGKGVVHHMQPAAISLTQASEAGTVYRADEIAALAELARRHALGLHVDGARFANAVAHLGCAPADITWRAGIDVLSFGATKNGAAAAEAVIFFDRAKAADFEFRRKRGGHLLSKMRFLSAQLDAYLDNDLWLRNARHANAMATRLAGGLAGITGVHLRHPVEANEVFVEMPNPLIEALFAKGFSFYRWDGERGNCVRLVTTFDTAPSDVDALLVTARSVNRDG